MPDTLAGNADGVGHGLDMTLSEIKQTLAGSEIRLTKSLGQNFLHDANQLRRIVNTAELSEREYVLEIGPGLGALTQGLLEAGVQLLAIEKDRRLFDFLTKRFAGEPRLKLVCDDALEYLKHASVDWTDWKVVSNLPYSVASPILVELAKAPGAPERIVTTVQLEVAQRISAKAGESDYGVLSLLLQARFQTNTAFKIPATCFFPVPDVDSACVMLVRRPNLFQEPGRYVAFEKIIKRSFSQRRKMMIKLLKADWPEARLREVFARLGLSPQARAETVSLEQYVELALLLNRTD